MSATPWTNKTEGGEGFPSAVEFWINAFASLCLPVAYRCLQSSSHFFFFVLNFGEYWIEYISQLIIKLGSAQVAAFSLLVSLLRLIVFKYFVGCYNIYNLIKWNGKRWSKIIKPVMFIFNRQQQQQPPTFYDLFFIFIITFSGSSCFKQQRKKRFDEHLHRYKFRSQHLTLTITISTHLQQ